ncbi:hypothetical protein SGUI_1235 [Serinicoccus hydrothermalis]|uniref:N-acetyltransferase domain-containing protein n=1 Tax=Serinicoccus hydrothermalis TaxID=1758689 RepID=A0A1B1NB35_9MICO|nr:N-acetyltransferase [Serinicoccus hydrothermalis]ANS78631.1 hypothetical protein SGUI_1235 [Serinicoccus hydrothermalis]
MTITPADAAQRDAAIDIVVAAQRSPATACAYLGTEAEGIRAELDDLDTPWQETLRVAVDPSGRVVGAVLHDVDPEDTMRSWIHGPWTLDDRTWSEHAVPLVRAALEQLPPGVERHELSAAPAHTGMARLAADLGWHATGVSIAYRATTATAQRWPAAAPDARVATPADLDALTSLHDEAFPGTYASARQLLADEARATLVLERDGEVAGYASGEIQADGAGYLDFLAIAPGHRGTGLAPGMLSAISRELLRRSGQGTVDLVVDEVNAPAVALYEGFGYVRDAELLGYRSWPQPQPQRAG